MTVLVKARFRIQSFVNCGTNLAGKSISLLGRDLRGESRAR